MPEAPIWLLLLHQIPARPTRLRVRVWRQIQKLGAVAVKNSAHVLPWSEQTLEDFTWLQQEIEAGGGEAVLFRASTVSGVTDEAIVAAFRQDRDAAYARVTADLEAVCERLDDARGREMGSTEMLDVLQSEVNDMQAEFDRVERIDFFKARGRAEAVAQLARSRRLLRSVQGRGAGAPEPAGSGPELDRSEYQGKRWVTRPRPHIDRCASAWLIRRFIDPRARFGFREPDAKLRGGIAFDMAGAEFGHQGEDCTFETLMKRFGLDADASLRAIAEIVHDIDLKDDKFGRTEVAGVNTVVSGLMERNRDDRRLLRETETVFDGLYATLARPPARRRKRAAKRRR